MWGRASDLLIEVAYDRLAHFMRRDELETTWTFGLGVSTGNVGGENMVWSEAS